MAVPYDDAVMQALAVLSAARTVTAQAAIVEAMAARLVDVVAGRQDDAAPTGVVRCEHPEEQRADAGTLRAPSRYFCRLCREFVNPAAKAADQT